MALIKNLSVKYCLRKCRRGIRVSAQSVGIGIESRARMMSPIHLFWKHSLLPIHVTLSHNPVWHV